MYDANQVIKNPFSRHMPAGAHVYGFSVGGQLYSPRAFAQSLPDDGKPIVFVVGAMAAGAIQVSRWLRRISCFRYKYCLSSQGRGSGRARELEKFSHGPFNHFIFCRFSILHVLLCACACFLASEGGRPPVHRKAGIRV